MGVLTEAEYKRYEANRLSAYIAKRQGKTNKPVIKKKFEPIIPTDLVEHEYQQVYYPPTLEKDLPAPVQEVIPTVQQPIIEQQTVEVVEEKNEQMSEPIIVPPIIKESLTPQEVLNRIRRLQERKEGFKKMDVAIKYGFIGIGQAGGRIAAEFGKLGYPTCAINTSDQDLSGIDVDQKLKIGNQGGAGKNMAMGLREAQENASQITNTIRTTFAGLADYVIMCLGSSGGTGAGAWPVILDALETGGFKNKVGAIVTLPTKSEDTESKKNTLKSINDLSKVVFKTAGSTPKISPMIIVDNDSILDKYPDLGIAEFWEKANKDIAITFHKINLLAIQNPKFASTLDKEDYRRIITSGGCMIYGEGPLDNTTNRDIILSITNLTESGLLAKGFNLTDSNCSGALFVGNEDALKGFPMADQQFALNEMRKTIGAGTVFSGTYEISAAKGIQILTIIGDLGLPVKRIKDLIRETKEQVDQVQKTTEKKTTIDDIWADVESNG